MEDVWPIFVDQNSVLVVMIVCVATDVRTLVTQQDLLVRTSRQPLREHAAREPGAYNQIIKHGPNTPLVNKIS
jgi:hypothetical protein